MALAYGVNHYAVWGNQMMSEDDPQATAVAGRSALRPAHPRAPRAARRNYDPYALRPLLTRYLARRFGYEIYVNGHCQPPCGVYNVPLPEEFP